MSSTSVSSVPGEWANPVGRLIGVIFSPTETFQSIARRPGWIAPVVLVCLSSLAVTLSFSHRVGWRSLFEKQDAKLTRFEQLSAAQQQATIDAQMKFAPKLAYIGAITPALAILVVSCLLLGLFNGLSGADLRFSTAVGITAHAWLPLAILSWIGLLVVWLRDPSTIDLQNLVASNPGAFLSDDAPRSLTALLSALDIFSFWTMFLLAMGFHAAAPKQISFGKALGYIFVPWFLFVLARVGLAAVLY